MRICKCGCKFEPHDSQTFTDIKCWDCSIADLEKQESRILNPTPKCRIGQRVCIIRNKKYGGTSISSGTYGVIEEISDYTYYILLDYYKYLGPVPYTEEYFVLSH